ncbi:hypothetical protein MASR1M31_12810 [Porphyromonadaceae bacterium]
MNPHINKQLLWTIIIVTQLSCNSTKENTGMFPSPFSHTQTSTVKLSEIGGNHVDVISLETTAESLLGTINKIVEFDKDYYVLSNDRWICRFDLEGRFISKLNRLGNGPGEYSYIGDFDVYDVNGRKELWLCDFKSIMRYDVDSLKYVGSIEFSYVVNKFIRYKEDRILLMAGQNENSLAVVDTSGNCLKEYLPKQVPFLSFRAVQFIPMGENILFQLGMSNSVVEFTPGSEEFQTKRLFEDDVLLTDSELVELYEKMETDFLRELKNRKYVGHIRFTKNRSHFTIRKEGDILYYSIGKDGNKLSVPITEKSGLFQNDLFDYQETDFLMTLDIGLSDRSTIFYIQPRIDKEEIEFQFKDKVIRLNEESNPCLVVFMNRRS